MEDTGSSLAESVCIESALGSGEDKEGAGPSSAESVQIKPTLSSDTDSSEEEEGGNRSGPHNKTSRVAHRGCQP